MAGEIQLKTPNWLFGQRKYEGSGPGQKGFLHERVNMPSQIESSGDGGCNLEWLSPIGDLFEEDIFQRCLAITSVDETSGWYGGALLYDQDENNEAYKHYAAMCQSPAVELFEDDLEKEKHYSDVLWMGLDGSDDGKVEAEMEAILKE